MRSLLIDGDVVLHRCTAAVEREVPVDRYRVLMANVEEAKGAVEEFIEDLVERSEADEVAIAFSHSENWRKELFPEYKVNRKGLRKPIGYYDVLEWMKHRWPSLTWLGIEADDILGIKATDPDHRWIIWSLDKDLKQVPGLHLDDDDVVEVTEAEGDWMHMYQTLVGDPVDGYSGCPGVGDIAAREFLSEPYRVVPTERILKTGKNAGSTQIIWKKEPTDNLWEGIVSLYEKAGLGAHEALTQARVSRILRHGEYKQHDDTTKEVSLWKPTNTSPR